MNKDKKQNIVRIFVAIGLSLLTFIYVSYENSSYIQSTSPNGNASIQGTEVLTNIPIEININRDQYFVSGIPETATVTLKGPQSILTQVLGTQSIVASTPDLNTLGTGSHTIDLTVDNLPNQISYEIEPEQVDITIEERVSKTFDVNVSLDESYVAKGYTIGEPTLSQDTVEVTGLKSAVNAITNVEVAVPPQDDLYTEDINQTLPIALYDANGELVDANVSPEEIAVSIPISGDEKTVPITLDISGDDSADYDYDINLSADQDKEVTLTGTQTVLNRIDEVIAEVDVSSITTSGTVTVPLNIPDGVTGSSIDKVNIDVKVTAIADDASASETTRESESENDASTSSQENE